MRVAGSMRFRKGAMSNLGKNVVSVGKGCNRMSLKERKVNLPQVAIGEDKVTSRGDPDKRRKSTGKTARLCGEKKSPW